MKDTGASLGITGGRLAEFYGEDGKKYPREVITVLGAGGLSSTVEDLCRFAGAFIPGGKFSFLQNAGRDTPSPPTPFAASLKGQTSSKPSAGIMPFSRLSGTGLPDGGQKRRKTTFYSTNLQILPSRGLRQLSFSPATAPPSRRLRKFWRPF